MTEGRYEMRRAVLAAALRSAPFDGWSKEALHAAGNAAGLDREEIRTLFPGGANQLLKFFMAEADRNMATEAERRSLDEGRVPERIAAIVRLRLEQLAPHREAIRRALIRQMLPGQAPDAIAGLWRTVDAVWRAAGDDSVDFNYYTKRAILAGVYSATLLYWLDDDSEDFAETWAFLERRLAGTAIIGKARRRVEKITKRLPSPLSPLVRLRYGRGA